MELTILAQSPQGYISRYSIRLVDMFENLQSIPLELKYLWTGHHNDIKAIIKSSGTDSFVSLASDEGAILWDFTKPEISQVFFYYIDKYIL